VESLERALNSRSRTKESTGRGTRLPTDWQPSEADLAFARDRALSPTRIDAEAEKFRNYWTAKSGSDACKRDWSATWRNWIINTTEKGYGLTSWGQSPRTDSTSRRTASRYDPTLAGVARFAAKRGLARGPERP